MAVEIGDNNDLMAVISSDSPDVMAQLKHQGAFKRVHEMTPELWLVRMSLDNDSLVLNTFRDAGAVFKIVFTRYTSSSFYRSHSDTDKTNGSKLTGLRITP